MIGSILDGTYGQENTMIKNQRRFKQERQPRLPLTATDRAVNAHDAKREASVAEQLPLIPPLQPKLF
jgi:hypothetical protein